MSWNSTSAAESTYDAPGLFDLESAHITQTDEEKKETKKDIERFATACD
jgi:hypothetical protein